MNMKSTKSLSDMQLPRRRHKQAARLVAGTQAEGLMRRTRGGLGGRRKAQWGQAGESKSMRV
jgi:hypothetical protein